MDKRKFVRRPILNHDDAGAVKWWDIAEENFPARERLHGKAALAALLGGQHVGRPRKASK